MHLALLAKVLDKNFVLMSFSNVLQRGRRLILISLLGISSPTDAGTTFRNNEHYHPKRLLITYRSASDGVQLENVHRAYAVKVQKHPRTRLHVLTLPEGFSVKRVAEDYVSTGLVEVAEPDFVRQINATPNDPSYLDGKLWWLDNKGQNGGLIGADINAPDAWDTLSSAENIVVAVLDTGIRATHEDLAQNIWTHAATGGYGWNALAQTELPADDEGHGSLVAGVLGAAGNNGKGVTGVAWSVKLMACKCFDSHRLGYDSDIIACIDFARTNGARVINASVGAYSYSHALSNAIYAARTDGIIFVAACGNDGRNIDFQPYYPASYEIDNIVSVGFSSRHDTPGTISNFGTNHVHLVAPGEAMYSTFFASDASYLGGAFLVGTSLAAPQVSGALALTLARFPGEPHTLSIQRLLAAVDSIPSLDGRCKTGGRLNLKQLLNPAIHLRITGTGVEWIIEGRTSPQRICIIESSPDLQNWSVAGVRVSGSNGRFEFSDFFGNLDRGFYRVLSPE